MTEPVRLWVVDDDHAVRYVLVTALRDAGYAVEAFSKAADALDVLHAGAVPALVITDVRMPGDGGLQLLDKLKAAQPQLPVIVMSAYTDVASTAGAFRGGAHEFLSKPFDLDEALALVRRALPEPTPVATPVIEPAAADGSLLVGHAPAMR
ncbi:MAG TPA: response regulator, partial [Thermomonas sp.]|nr:response regulator [Thermomonas sp.]